MPEMIFEWINGVASPRSPFDEADRERVPDGKTWLSLEQAADRTGQSPEQLRILYLSVLPQLQAGQAPALDAADAPAENSPSIDWGGLSTREREWSVFRHIVCKDLPDEAVAQFQILCTELGVNGAAGQLIPTMQWSEDRQRNELVVITPIATLRSLADRTGLYAGVTTAQWCGEDEQWKDVWVSSQPPVACRIGVRRKDMDSPIWATALWRSYAQYCDDGNGGMKLTEFWQRMGPDMLEKCAEAKSFRKALPAQLGKLYAPEEINRGKTQGQLQGAEAAPVPEAPEADPYSQTSEYDDGCQLPDWDVAGPRTQAQFEEALKGLGYTTALDRQRIIETYHRRLGRPTPRQQLQFFARVLREEKRRYPDRVNAFSNN